MSYVVVVIGLLVAVGLVRVVARFFRPIAVVCPYCAHHTSERGLTDGLVWTCVRCHGFIHHRAGNVAALPDNFVAPRPIFEIRLPELTHPREWRDPWPGRCCVCGAATEGRTSIEGHMIKDVRLDPGYMRTATDVYQLELGCCATCKEAVNSPERFDPPALRSVAKEVPIRLRSYAFWRDFRAHNGRGPKL